MSSKTYTLKEIKDAINKHNKELNNDIKVSFSSEGIKFSSAKAEKEIFKATLKQPLPVPKKVPRAKKEIKELKGQKKLAYF